LDIEKPIGAGKREEVKLDTAASHLLEECRMVLPGIQALFGFQLIAVFSDSFGTRLSPGQQQLHFLALVLVALSAALVMTPAAIHRQTQLRTISERFVWLSSWLLLFGMLPLAVGLSVDVYLIGCVALGSTHAGIAVAAALLAVLLALWLVLPRRERRIHRASQ
jgi:hypothetical protein